MRRYKAVPLEERPSFAMELFDYDEALLLDVDNVLIGQGWSNHEKYFESSAAADYAVALIKTPFDDDKRESLQLYTKVRECSWFLLLPM